MNKMILELPATEEILTKLAVIDSKLESIQKTKALNKKVLTSKEAAQALRVTTRTLHFNAGVNHYHFPVKTATTL